MTIRRRIVGVAAVGVALSAAALATDTAAAYGQPPQPGVAGTTSEGSAVTGPAQVTDQAVTTFYSVELHGGYLAAGTAMRNQGFGHVRFGQIPDGSTVRAAYLVWDILGNKDTARNAKGRFSGHPIVGTLAATGPSPCWSATLNAAYVADVTPYVTGNGRYRLRHFASGQRDGQDPWSGSKVPMMEGATLMVVYQNPESPLTHVDLAAGATAGTEAGTMSSTFDGFVVAENPSVKTTFVVADGQPAGDGPTTFNGQRLRPSRWNGQDHQNAPDYSGGNLWDTRSYDVSGAASPGQTSAEATITIRDDCLVWVGQALSVNL